ncbi:MAG: MTH1187 family thiamine-binding protein [Corynebacteriales bacterium]|nr:MTH1187 family thiamine-binding protein [Mycobacteriales bacterium]
MIVGFSITPIGVNESVSPAVAEAVKIVRESGLPNETNAMSTLIEGEWDEVMAVIKRAADAVAAHSPRVSVEIKADIRQGVEHALTSKVESLENKLSA